MTLRTALFTLYGTAIGMAYFAVLAIAWPLSAVLTAIISIVVVAAFSYFRNRLPKAAEMSDWQSFVAIPTFPVRVAWRNDRVRIHLALRGSHVALCCHLFVAGGTPLSLRNEDEEPFCNS